MSSVYAGHLTFLEAASVLLYTILNGMKGLATLCRTVAIKCGLYM
jgi:hypothetical protein